MLESGHISKSFFVPSPAMTRADPALLAQLNATSEAYRDPLMEVDWARLSLEDWWLPGDAISLAGLPEYEALTEATRRRLSQYEFVHFLHVGLWLERIFMHRLAGALHGTGSALEYAAHLHEIREEAGHSLMFLKLMQQTGLHLPSRAFRIPRLADAIGRHAPLDSTLFWLAVTLGEELPDKFNRRIRAAGDGINPAVSRLCVLHMIDEARHIARARSVLDQGLQKIGPIRLSWLSALVSLLLGQFARTLFVPSEAIYELAGLAPGARWRRAAQSNPQRMEFMRQCVEPTLTLLRAHGLKIDLPQLR